MLTTVMILSKFIKNLDMKQMLSADNDTYKLEDPLLFCFYPLFYLICKLAAISLPIGNKVYCQHSCLFTTVKIHRFYFCFACSNPERNAEE